MSHHLEGNVMKIMCGCFTMRHRGHHEQQVGRTMIHVHLREHGGS